MSKDEAYENQYFLTRNEPAPSAPNTAPVLILGYLPFNIQTWVPSEHYISVLPGCLFDIQLTSLWLNPAASILTTTSPGFGVDNGSSVRMAS